MKLIFPEFPMKKLPTQRYSLLLLAFLSFQGCFEITHYVQKEADGGMKIQWMFSISSAFTKKEDSTAFPPPVPGSKGESGLKEKIKSSEKDLKEKLKGIVEDFQYKAIENEYETGLRIQFKVKDQSKISKVDGVLDEGFPLVPNWKEDKKQLLFRFNNKEKSKTNPPKTKDKESEGEESEAEVEESGQEDPTKKIMNMIMSSASYRIILGNSYQPKKVYIQGMASKKKLDLEFTSIGEQTHIRVPFMTLLMEDADGFLLIIQM